MTWPSPSPLILVVEQAVSTTKAAIPNIDFIQLSLEANIHFISEQGLSIIVPKKIWIDIHLSS
jgi:hypothetical protein